MEAIFTYKQLHACAAREVALRRNVYAKHGISADREREIDMMQAIAEILAELAANSPNALVPPMERAAE